MKNALIFAALAAVLVPVRLRAEACITVECHAGFKKLAFLHAPAQEDCLTCHVKTAEHQFKPVAIKGLCEQCHSEKSEGPVVHAALDARTCPECHNPHGGKNKAFLKADRQDSLCFECHDQGPLKRKVVHGALAEGQCSLCHDPHSSKIPKLLKSPPGRLCLSCHTDKSFSGAGMHKHEPLDNGCAGCHNPHGSGYYKMLTRPFPETFYTAFDAEKYGLCFNCHEKSMVRDAQTTTLTNFRNGRVNLHFLHINREKGRTCRACHEVHAGNQPHHLRRETPFGGWDIPIDFTKTATGGSCAPGCHRAVTYARAE